MSELTYHRVEQIQLLLGVTNRELAELLNVFETILYDGQKSGTLADGALAEQLILIERLIEQGGKIFTKVGGFSEWL